VAILKDMDVENEVASDDSAAGIFFTHRGAPPSMPYLDEIN
jgi:hypothetical protein